MIKAPDRVLTVGQLINQLKEMSSDIPVFIAIGDEDIRAVVSAERGVTEVELDDDSEIPSPPHPIAIVRWF